MVRSILELCKNTPIARYYESLDECNRETNVIERETKIKNSDASMMKYYCSIVNVDEISNIYTNLVDDRFRFVISRWRLSNHKLRIETGRYHVPYIPRENRTCYECNILEDEKHAIYDCPAFSYIRRNYVRVLEKYTSVKTLLNPDPSDIYEVAQLLSEIDDVLNKR